MTLPQHMNSTPSEHPYLSQNMDSTPSRPHPSQIDSSTPSRNPSGFNVVPGTPSPKPPSFSTLANVPPSSILPEATHDECIVTITNQQTKISDEFIITSDHTAIEPPIETSIDAHVKTPEVLAEVEIMEDLEPNGTETVVENHSRNDKGTEAALPQGDDINIGDTVSFVVVIQKEDQDSQPRRVETSETEFSSGEEDVDTSGSKDSVSSPGETDGKHVFLIAGLTLTIDMLAGGGIVGGSEYWSSSSPSPYHPAGIGMFTGAVRRDGKEG